MTAEWPEERPATGVADPGETRLRVNSLLPYRRFAPGFGAGNRGRISERSVEPKDFSPCGVVKGFIAIVGNRGRVVGWEQMLAGPLRHRFDVKLQ